MSLEYDCLTSICKNIIHGKPLLTIEDKLNWKYFDFLAENHRLNSLLFPILKNNNKVPYWLNTKLKNEYLTIVANNLLILNECKSICSVLSNNKINFVFLKGITTTNIIYNETQKRVIRDIDILIEYKDIRNTKNILCELGYTVIKKGSGEVVFEHISKKTYIEVHWYIRSIVTKTKTLLNHKSRCQTDGYIFPALSLECRLLHSCIHWASRHQMSNLLNLLEISLFVQKYNRQIDWPLLINLASRFHCKNSVYISFYSAINLFNIQLPLQILEKIKIETFSADRFLIDIENKLNFFTKSHIGKAIGNDIIYEYKLADSITWFFVNWFIIIFRYKALFLKPWQRIQLTFEHKNK